MTRSYDEITRVVEGYEMIDMDPDNPLGFHSPEIQAARDISEGKAISFVSRRLISLAELSLFDDSRPVVLAEVGDDDPEFEEQSEHTKKLVAGIANALAILIEDIRPILPDLQEKEYFLMSNIFEAAMRDLHPWKGAAIDKARTPVSSPRPMGQPDEINYPMPN